MLAPVASFFKALSTLDWWLHEAWGLKTVILAGLFTAGEAMLQSGVEIPGMDRLPGWSRGLVYLVVVGGGFLLRYLTSRSKPDTGAPDA